MSVKLPYSSYEALKLPFSKPTGYGLGRSGWVTIEPVAGQMPSLDVLKLWIDESYRAQAPKKLGNLCRECWTFARKENCTRPKWQA